MVVIRPKDNEIKSLSAFVWSIAITLRGDFKQSEYGKVVLPFIVLRRLDCILENTKTKVLDLALSLPEDLDDEARDRILFETAGPNFKVYNYSKFTFASLRGQDAKDIHKNLLDYVTKFSSNVRDIFLEKFLFTDQLKRLNDAGLLYKVFEQFAQIDLHPELISNLEMGYLFEELIRRFSEISNETAGEHYTPREVIRLIVSLLLENDKDALTGSGVIRQVYDPAAGTGGMLSIAEMEMQALNQRIRVELFGQELNPESFAICKSDMLVTDHNPENIAFGNTLTNDAHKEKSFHYMLSNPPYGVDWSKYDSTIKKEKKEQGMLGRFGAGLPRISDGQLLFLQHMISKMRDDEKGSRIGIVMNGSPLFIGGAASGESEIRRWMLENDWIEAIIALPTDLFYNTGIQTYVWLLTNRKSFERRGKVQLIDSSNDRFWKLMRKSLGSKRREITQEAIHEITFIYSEMLSDNSDLAEFSKVFAFEDFGYREIRVERPLKLSFKITKKGLASLHDAKSFQKLNEDEQKRILHILEDKLPNNKRWIDRVEFIDFIERVFVESGIKVGAPLKRSILSVLSERDDEAMICIDGKGRKMADPELRNHELVPLGEDWREYFDREVLPFVPDAWVDESYVDESDGKVGRVGYEVNFNRYFYTYVPPRPIEEIDTELKTLEAEIETLMKEVLK